ncbi:MAG: 2-oxoacid:acceptor oxidoreductase family protein [Phycisphaerales bacterium]
MKDPVQLRFSGAGGQGLITAGVILSEAAMLDGLNVVQTQTYGPEARLGSSKAEVIISTRHIAYPEVTVPDVLLCMSHEAAKKYMPKVRADTVVVVDSTCVSSDFTGPGRHVRMPITDTAITVGSKVVANAVALFAINTIEPVVSRESLLQAITARVPAKYRELNQRAALAGEELAKNTLAAL